jgi:hypothetical protein
MNCRPGNRRAFIIFLAQQWAEIAAYGTEKWDRAWARRNYLRLLRSHPEIFALQEPTAESAEPSAGALREIHVAPVHTQTSKSQR